MGWLLKPNLDAVTFVVNELKFLSTLQRSLVAMSGLRELLAVAKLYAQEKGAGAIGPAFDTLIAESPAEWAKEYVDSDFAIPNAHSLIASWGVIETCVEETVVNLLQNAGVARLASVDPKLVADKTAVDEAAARELYDKLERRLRDTNSVAEAYTKMLAIYDIEVSCEAEIYAMLAEVNELRNCLLHRGGTIDEKACRKAPQLRPLLGKRIVITSKDFGRYTEALHTFVVAMTTGIVNSPVLKPAADPI